MFVSFCEFEMRYLFNYLFQIHFFLVDVHNKAVQTPDLKPSLTPINTAFEKQSYKQINSL